jgi:hypothetical protein
MSAARSSERSAARGSTAPAPGALYALGVLGAWVWFWQQADGFWGHVWSVIQGVLWPAFMVYRAFHALS